MCMGKSKTPAPVVAPPSPPPNRFEYNIPNPTNTQQKKAAIAASDNPNGQAAFGSELGSTQ